MLDRSKAWICDSSLAEIAGLKPTRVMDVCLVRVLCVVREIFARDEHLSRRVLPIVFF